MADEKQLIQTIYNIYAKLQAIGIEAPALWKAHSVFLEQEYRDRLAQSQARAQQAQAQAINAHQQQLNDLNTRAQQTQASIRNQIWQATRNLGWVVKDWSAPDWNQFAPLVNAPIPSGIRVGTLKPNNLFALPPVPALVSFLAKKHLLIVAEPSQTDAANGMLQSVALRLAAAFPAGALRFSLIDPLAMGANLTAFLTLPEVMRGERVACNEHEIAQGLAELAKHIETVIQTRLGYTFQTIEEYNARVGEISVPYHFIVIANFPAGFSDPAAQYLLGIARNGPRAGVYVLATLQPGAPPPHNFDLHTFQSLATVLTATPANEFEWNDPGFPDCRIVPDRMPAPGLVKNILTQVGQMALQHSKQGLAFSKIMTPAPWWARQSEERLAAAIGLNGSGAPHAFDVGTGVVHHALVGGQTGSGKTNLLHVLICNLALAYPPSELELYLVDFKEGVEFQDYVTYALPHARAIAIESEREFGLSILRHLQSEIEKRGQLFRTVSVSSLTEYRRKTRQVLPRILLIVDEYQILFREDDRLAQEASNVLEDLVKRGRSFGIHVLLSSQSPGSKFISNRAVYDQIALRLCMQCREADARLILGDENDGAKLLERPGEAIYNSENGRPEKNVFLRVALFPPAERQQSLEKIRQLEQQHRFKRATPLTVFQGSASALLQQNRDLWQMIWSPTFGAANAPVSAWLGEAIEIKPHTAAVFERQSRSNLLVVGQEEKATRGILASTLLSVCAQRKPTEATFFLIDLANADADPQSVMTQLQASLPHRLEIANRAEAPALIERLSKVVAKRATQSGNPGLPQIFFWFFGLHRLRELRGADAYTPTDLAKTLAQVCQDGPEVGVHTLIWCDNVASFDRVFRRASLDWFDARVAFLLQDREAMDLMGDLQASKLAPNRALFRNQEWEAGRYEKFKPYILPEPPVIAEIVKRLKRKT